ncbi:MAG: VWA domain-containing protein [Gammaproteobacteria bacterium]|nr:VWA domain-containing protein [Gammaproteobacteria bacterium]
MNTYALLLSAEFRQPLWLLLILIPLASLLFHYFFSGMLLSSDDFDPEMRYWYLNHNTSYKISNKKYLLLNFIFWLLFSIALAGPQYPETVSHELNNTGENILVLLDASASMNAADEHPSRLIRARNEILLLVEKLKSGDRLGVMLFSSSSHLLFPPTTDKNAMRFYLQQIKQDMLPVAGSVFESALFTAQKQLQKNNTDAPGYILLVSDGDVEDEQITLNKIDQLKLKSPVYVLGVGKKQNSPVPSFSGRQHWLTSDNGTVIVSNRNDSFLQNISDHTNGKYRALSNTESDLDDIYNNGIKQSSYTSKEKDNINWIQLYHPFLLTALMLLFYQHVLRSDN